MSINIRWAILITSLVLLYAVTYFVFSHLSTGQSIFGNIPEVLLYIIPTYFISSVLIEILVGDAPNRNIRFAIIKALIILLFFLLFAVSYWLFYTYIIIANQLEKTFIGEKSYFFFIALMVFFGIKYTNKLSSKEK